MADAVQFAVELIQTLFCVLQRIWIEVKDVSRLMLTICYNRNFRKVNTNKRIPEVLYL